MEVRVWGSHDSRIDCILTGDPWRGPGAITGNAGLLHLPGEFTGTCTIFSREHRPTRLRLAPNQALPEVVPLLDLVRLRLKVWTHSGGDPIIIRDHVANLNLILNGLNPAGVVFDLESIAALPTEAWNLIGYNCWNEHEVRRSPYFDSRAVNVYYHPTPDVSARCCHGGDLVFIPPGSPLGRLAHEIGHALGLRGDGDGSGVTYDDGHTDSLPEPSPFTPDNIMWRGDAILRSHLTLGQIAWIHGSERSVLTRLGRQAVQDRLPPWADDSPDRRPEPETRDLETALTDRYAAIVSYWDQGRRPEGQPGSASAEEFVRLHLR